MATAKKLRDVYAEQRALPDGVNGEILAGELHTSPRPRHRHAYADEEIRDVLRAVKRKRGGGWLILGEPELHLGDDILIPDIAGWRAERAPSDPDEAAATVVPDWVCEILSPRTASYDRIRKADRYAHFGVPWMWIVDPAEQSLEIYALRDGLWARVGGGIGDAELSAPPFDGLTVQIREWWWPGEPILKDPEP